MLLKGVAKSLFFVITVMDFVVLSYLYYTYNEIIIREDYINYILIWKEIIDYCNIMAVVFIVLNVNNETGNFSKRSTPEKNL